MSRSGYSDDTEQWHLIMWRGAVVSAIRGKRGQAFLAEMLAALDAMPVKELAAEVLVKDGCMCALGAVANARGLDVSDIDPEDFEAVSETLKIPNSLAREIAYLNDDDWPDQMPANRWRRMRYWVAGQIKASGTVSGAKS